MDWLQPPQGPIAWCCKEYEQSRLSAELVTGGQYRNLSNISFVGVGAGPALTMDKKLAKAMGSSE